MATQSDWTLSETEIRTPFSHPGHEKHYLPVPSAPETQVPVKGIRLVDGETVIRLYDSSGP